MGDVDADAWKNLLEKLLLKVKNKKINKTITGANLGEET